MDEATKMQPGDAAQAEALRIADEHLKRMGWKYTPADVGKNARLLLDAMAAPPAAPSLNKIIASQPSR